MLAVDTRVKQDKQSKLTSTFGHYSELRRKGAKFFSSTLQNLLHPKEVGRLLFLNKWMHELLPRRFLQEANKTKHLKSLIVRVKYLRG